MSISLTSSKTLTWFKCSIKRESSSSSQSNTTPSKPSTQDKTSLDVTEQEVERQWHTPSQSSKDSDSKNLPRILTSNTWLFFQQENFAFKLQMKLSPLNFIPNNIMFSLFMEEWEFTNRSINSEIKSILLWQLQEDWSTFFKEEKSTFKALNVFVWMKLMKCLKWDSNRMLKKFIIMSTKWLTKNLKACYFQQQSPCGLKESQLSLWTNKKSLSIW